MRQRRGSVAFRVNTKSAFPDNLPRLSANNLQISSTFNEEPSKADQQGQDGPSPVPLSQTNLTFNDKRPSPVEYPDVPIDRNNSAKSTIKSSRGNSAMKNESISQAKGSAACAIQ